MINAQVFGKSFNAIALMKANIFKRLKQDFFTANIDKDDKHCYIFIQMNFVSQE